MRRFVLVVLMIAAVGCSDQGDLPSEFEARSVSVGGKTYNYRVFTPKNRDPNLKLPVMLYLHGSGSRGDDNTTQVENLEAALAGVKDKIDFIVVAPQCPDGTFWAATDVADYALAALDKTVNELNGDEQKLYLAGFSLGGYGTWQIAAANPGKFAALIPVAGGVIGERPIEPRDREVIIPEVGRMLDSSEPYEALAKSIGQTPVWVFHGANDDAVPVDFSRRIVKALGDAGNDNVKYTEYPNEGHMIFSKSINEPGVLEWLKQQRVNNGK